MKPKRPPASEGRHRRRIRPYLRRTFAIGVLLLTILILFTAAGTGVAAGYIASLLKEEPLRNETQLRQQLTGWTQTSHAYFGDGSPIGAMRTAADRKWVAKEEVSPALVDALIATEDHRFYEHSGISLHGILRAAWHDLKTGSIASGGSTITQQLVKNVILENREKALERKAKEIAIALRLERMLPKDEILTFYLNSLYFGKGIHHRNLLGVQAAAKGIFGVDARHLNLAQAAYLAGMIQRPTAFNPFSDEGFQAGARRMRTVLSRMRQTGKITPEAEAQALQFDLKSSLARGEEKSAYHRHPFLMAAVEDEAAKLLMKTEGLKPAELSRQGLYHSTLEQYRKRILTGGYRIDTTVDPRLYQAVNRAALDRKLYAKPITYTLRLGGKKHTVKDAHEEVGAVLIDVQSGSLLAFVGGRDFEQRQLNHALAVRRQPGSTIKPLLDYGPALDQKRVTPATIVVDEPLSVDGAEGKTYKNYNNRYQGPVTVREALKWSLNIPAIKLLRKIGVHEGFRYLESMDFPIHPRDGEASAIGGFTRGFTVAEMTAGYAMLANHGEYRKPWLIRRIVDADGQVIYQYRPQPRHILSPSAAWLTTDMLRDVIQSGTGRWVGARARGHELAGKTGTTQNGHDVWFIGYTPRIALGVWVGYDYNHPLPDDRRAKRVWSRIFQTAVHARPRLSPKGATFTQPEGLEKMEICKVTGQLATENCRAAKAVVKEKLPADQIPEEICLQHGEERIVVVEGKEYVADPRTPPDLTRTQTGLRVPKQEEDRYKYYRGNRLPLERDPRISLGAPTPPQVTAIPFSSGVKLTWRPSDDTALAGYRIYREGQLVASIRLGEPPVFTGPPGNYTVRAVDIAGLESTDGTPSAPIKRPQSE
ncbi:hypothetical protein GCM10007416_23290 [Kroppenstedtia guangzhouensis]|uniref:Penicillin-sensitive transpeptidase n=1 Tax=Kroppenstedtia guangzhouensis TaxID=1274356 RepID=A0ABQ1GSG6_9BACL|nr:transglycosylase domain-containing protein [Kroppenstedtia guangzhouensis]GGA49548.1 hypothetical protein GCM10007416_23290 [Kroppenstedtia guangzhouensis]